MNRRNRQPARPWFLPRRYIALALFLTVAAAFAYGYLRFDRAILPLIQDAAELKLQTEMNNVINTVIQDIIREGRLSADDFYSQRDEVIAGAPVLSVNTLLVNDICNEAAKRISNRLNNMEPETVSIPAGMAFRFDTLSQVGPRLKFNMAPIGNALVSHESSFTAVGINQTHFSVSLTVGAVVRVINPVHSFEVEVNRHISLVDTIISGVVPDTYLKVDR
jgi:sporulation protein YunB